MGGPFFPAISAYPLKSFLAHRKSSLAKLAFFNLQGNSLSVPKILTLFIPEILSRPTIARRAETLSVPPVGEPVGRRGENVRNVKASRSRQAVPGDVRDQNPHMVLVHDDEVAKITGHRAHWNVARGNFQASDLGNFVGQDGQLNLSRHLQLVIYVQELSGHLFTSLPKRVHPRFHHCR
jgi:hypothetical protein